jgi:hypothetical protein
MLFRQHNIDEEKKKHNTIWVGHHYAQTNRNGVNKTRALLQTTRDKDEPNIVLTSCSYTNNIILQIILSDDLLTFKEEGYVLFFNFL